MRSGRHLSAAALVCAAGMLLAAGTGTAVAAQRALCRGSSAHPGLLAGTYNTNVVIEGTCRVNAGPATIRGNLTLAPGSTLLALYALDDRKPGGPAHSKVTVFGNVNVGADASLQLGCEPIHEPCLDFQVPEEPEFYVSHDRVYGSIKATDALAVNIHASTINGGVTQTSGGGGASCIPQAGSEEPVFSDYEDDSISGGVSIKSVFSCWMGLARDRINGNVSLVGNTLADPDAIEILANTIWGNLKCVGNSMVWDSAEVMGEKEPEPETPEFLWHFPRIAEPNHVLGKRSGQCVHEGKLTLDGPEGEGPF